MEPTLDQPTMPKARTDNHETQPLHRPAPRQQMGNNDLMQEERTIYMLTAVMLAVYVVLYLISRQ